LSYLIGSGGKWYAPLREKLAVFAAILGIVIAAPYALR
jgi:hypothetical protein